MSVRAFIVEMRPGDPPLVVLRKRQADYIREIAIQLGVILRQRKLEGYWELWRIPGKRGGAFYLLRFRERQRIRQQRRRLDPERKILEKLSRNGCPGIRMNKGSPAI